VVLFAHRLPVAAVPEESHVAAMRLDVIDDGGDGDLFLTCHALRALTQWVRPEVAFAGLLPFVAVATLMRIASLLVLNGLPMLTMCIAESRRSDQRTATSLAAGLRGS